MIVLGTATIHRQPVLFVLDITPEQIVQRPQRIDRYMRERIAIAEATYVLETPADGIYRLNQHSFLVPVRPDQLDQADAIGTRCQHVGAEHAVAAHIARKCGAHDAFDIGQTIRAEEVRKRGHDLPDGDAGPRALFLSRRDRIL